MKESFTSEFLSKIREQFLQEKNIGKDIERLYEKYIGPSDTLTPLNIELTSFKIIIEFPYHPSQEIMNDNRPLEKNFDIKITAVSKINNSFYEQPNFKPIMDNLKQNSVFKEVHLKGESFFSFKWKRTLSMKK